MRAFILTIALLAAACSPPTPEASAPTTASAQPVETAATDTRPFVDAQGRAIQGYDPVSYFDGAPQRGDPAFFSDRDGARYLFASAANKARFDAEPQRFQPQYGGFCAYGAASGYKAPTEPETGVVIGGKLYFNYNKVVQTLFNLDRDGYIAKADAAWVDIQDDPPKQ